jgi:NADH dehydrogenase [ubiquinone] 1 alpha subcomplex assembly factor 5
VLDLVEHLRVLGETNAVRARRRSLRRDTALASAAAYHAMFGGEGDDATLPATFQVIYMTGWSPHANQQQAKKRGTATVSFADLAEHVDDDARGGAAPAPAPQ